MIGESLSDTISLLFNGSLSLQNLSLESEGTYVCTGTNALAKAKAIPSSTSLVSTKSFLSSSASYNTCKGGPGFVDSGVKELTSGRYMVLSIAVTAHLQTASKFNPLSYLFFSQKAVTALLLLVCLRTHNEILTFGPESRSFIRCLCVHACVPRCFSPACLTVVTPWAVARQAPLTVGSSRQAC